MELFLEFVNKFGVPIVGMVILGWFILFIWRWVTNEIKPVLSEADDTLLSLIDRIRMLDNDLIRLNQKLETTLELRGDKIEVEKYQHIEEINKPERKPRSSKLDRS